MVRFFSKDTKEVVSKVYFLPQRRTKYITKAHEVSDYQIINFVFLREILGVPLWFMAYDTASFF